MLGKYNKLKERNKLENWRKDKGVVKIVGICGQVGMNKRNETK
jgi:hypothetical protein